MLRRLSGGTMEFEEIYRSGEYLEKHPTWHIEVSSPKARDILEILQRASLAPRTICEVGCGAGEILAQLQRQMDSACAFQGYDISPQAIELARARENEQLHFTVADFTRENAFFDLILLIDMIEHVENCFRFLREIKAKGTYKIIQFALDITVETLLINPNALLGFRSTYGHVGHLHYFTKNTALAMLEDLGYEILDYRYVPLPVDKGESLSQKLHRPFIKLLYALNKDLAVRLLGGYKLLVLTK
jgi:predicted TPR repeat methyltransferase